MPDQPPVLLLLACLRGGRRPDDQALLADPQADWPGLVALVERWRLSHGVMAALPSLGAERGPPPAVRRQLQLVHRAAVLRQLQARARAMACIERLLQDGVVSVCVGDSALLGLPFDAADTHVHLPPLLLVRSSQLDPARAALAAFAGKPDAPDTVRVELQATLVDRWTLPGCSDEGLDLDAVLPWAERLDDATPGCLRAGPWPLLMHLWAGLGQRVGVPTLLRNVAAIQALRQRPGFADAAALRAQALQAGLSAGCAAAERLARAWLDGGPADPGPLGPQDLRLLDAVARLGPVLAARPTSRAERCRQALTAAAAQAVLARQPRPRIATPPPPGVPPPPVRAAGRVALTYDGRAMDGLGAQLHRIYSLYAMARALGLSYVHTPVQRIHYQGLLAMVDKQLDSHLCARADAQFPVPSDPFDRAHQIVADIVLPEPDTIAPYQRSAAESGRDVLIRAHLGLHYTDAVPECQHVLRAISPFRTLRPQGPLRVCVHMRRGDRVASQDPRQQPNSYFARVCEQLGQALAARGLDHVIRLHTELPKAPVTLRPQQEHMFITLHEPVTVTPEEHRLQDFAHIPQLDLVLNIGAVEALCEFCTADVLVLSYSSFGHVGALLNPHGLVVCGPVLPPPRNFHRPMAHWLQTDEDGHIGPARLQAEIDAMLVRRALQSGGADGPPRG